MDAPVPSVGPRPSRTVVGQRGISRQPVRRSRSDEVPAGEADTVAPISASSVHGDEARNRERQLHSLYASARDLTALGEVSDVVTAIVQRAHELLGTDIAYLSVFDETHGDLWVRATAGTVSEEFRQIHVPPGVGLAARIARTRMPQWVSRYLDTSTDLPHDQQIDHAVAAEGLVSMLGVPLLTGNRVTGVLFAGNRVERPFTPQEVALLSAFADHAAVALENARLYDQRKRALDDLQQAYQTIESHVIAIQAAQAVHEALTAAVLRGGQAGDLADVVASALHGHVAVLDRTDRVIATAGTHPHLAGVVGTDLRPHMRVDATTDLGRQLRAAATRSHQTGHCVSVNLADTLQLTVVAVAAGGTDFGTLVLAHGAELGAVDTRTLERAAQILALLTLNQTALVEAEEKVRGELLTELLTARGTVSRELSVRARTRDLDLSAPMILIVADSAARPSEVVRLLNAMPGGRIASEFSGVPTMIVNGTDAAKAADQVHARIRSKLAVPVRVCATGAIDDPTSLERAWSTANQSSRLLKNLGVEDRAITTDSLAMYTVLFDPTRAADLHRFLDQNLNALLDHDRRRGTQLIATLSAYFENGGNLARTARTLNVHINTLLRRVERVNDILGQDWQQPSRSLQLQLAIHLTSLRDTAP